MLGELQCKPVSTDAVSSVTVRPVAIPATNEHFHFGAHSHFDDASVDDVKALDSCLTVGAFVKFWLIGL